MRAALDRLYDAAAWLAALMMIGVLVMVVIAFASSASFAGSTAVLVSSVSLPATRAPQSTNRRLSGGVFSTLASSVVTSPESSLSR